MLVIKVRTDDERKSIIEGDLMAVSFVMKWISLLLVRGCLEQSDKKRNLPHQAKNRTRGPIKLIPNTNQQQHKRLPSRTVHLRRRSKDFHPALPQQNKTRERTL